MDWRRVQGMKQKARHLPIRIFNIPKFWFISNHNEREHPQHPTLWRPTARYPFISSLPSLLQIKTRQLPKRLISGSKSYLTDKQTISHRQTKGLSVRNQRFPAGKQKLRRHLKVHIPRHFMQNNPTNLHIIAFPYALRLLNEPFRSIRILQ